MNRLDFLSRYASDPEHYRFDHEMCQSQTSRNWETRMGAMFHPKATAKHISVALDDDSEDVRLSAIERLDVTPAHFEQASHDESAVIRRYIAGRKDAPLTVLDKLSRDTTHDVARTAILNIQKRKEKISK